MLIIPFALAADSSALDTGLAALKAKNADAAIVAFDSCVAAEPQHVECLWQRGWAHWLKRDWPSVVKDWEAVLAIDPAYPQAAAQLSQAKGQLEIMKMAAASRDAAPERFVSQAPDGASLRLRAVGDMMIGTDFPEGYLPVDKGASAFVGVLPLLMDADVTFGNLEGPLCDSTAPSTKCSPTSKPGACYAFRTPRSYAHWYKDSGFDVVSTANNHANDFGEDCRMQTEAELDAQGILYSGRPGTVAKWTTNGLKIALIGFHTAASGHDLTDIPTASALVKGLAAEHDLVIVSFHGGAEGAKAQNVPTGTETFYGENRGDLRSFSRAVIDAGADLVLGHGPHVLRGMEGYKDRLIVYSLGNFSTYGRFNLSGPQGIGAVLEVTLAKDGRFAGGKVLGTVQEGEGIPSIDATNQAADLMRVLSQKDFGATAAQVAQDGSIALPK